MEKTTKQLLIERIAEKRLKGLPSNLVKGITTGKNISKCQCGEDSCDCTGEVCNENCDGTDCYNLAECTSDCRPQESQCTSRV